jgi:hypothetical protein
MRLSHLVLVGWLESLKIGSEDKTFLCLELLKAAERIDKKNIYNLLTK